MNAEDGFWETLHLLIEHKKTVRDAMDEVEDWVNKIIARKKGLSEMLEEEEISVRSNASFRSELFAKEEIKKFQKEVNLPPIICKFDYPSGKSRVEKLMGSNTVSLTDRSYMQNLQHKIVQDYAHSMNKRISSRQAEELERVKNLVLIGKIPLENAPFEMADHPVMLIENYCNPKRSASRKKGKIRKLRLTKCSYFGETPSDVDGAITDEKHDMLSPIENNFEEDSDEVESHFAFDTVELTKYENSLIRELRECESVEEMYALADEIIGILRSTNVKPDDASEHSGKT